jgi:hypothetical protein
MESFSQLLLLAEERISQMRQAKAAKLELRGKLSQSLRQAEGLKTDIKTHSAYVQAEIDRVSEHNLTVQKDFNNLRVQIEESRQQLGVVSSVALGERQKLLLEIKAVSQRILEQQQKAQEEEQQELLERRSLKATLSELLEVDRKLAEEEEHLKEKVLQMNELSSSNAQVAGAKFRELEAMFE